MNVLKKLPNMAEAKLTEPFTVRLSEEQKNMVKRASEVARKHKKDFSEKVRQELVSLAQKILKESESV